MVRIQTKLSRLPLKQVSKQNELGLGRTCFSAVAIMGA